MFGGAAQVRMPVAPYWFTHSREGATASYIPTHACFGHLQIFQGREAREDAVRESGESIVVQVAFSVTIAHPSGPDTTY